MLESYDCPYTEFHKNKEDFCPYCNNHGIRLISDKIKEGSKIHLQLSKEPCLVCKGLGYIPKYEEFVSSRLGKKRKFKNKFTVECINCKGHKFSLNIIDFYDCTYKNQEGKCKEGQIPKWVEASYKFYEIPFWIDFLFKEKVEELVLRDCPKCHGTSCLEQYRRVTFIKDKDLK